MPYLSLIKMSRHSLQDQTNIPLIVTTNDSGSNRGSLDSGSFAGSIKANSCRSFASQQKLSKEHRNNSVPYNLQVDRNKRYMCSRAHWHVWLKSRSLNKAIIAYLHNSVAGNENRSLGCNIHFLKASILFSREINNFITWCNDVATLIKTWIQANLWPQHEVDFQTCLIN